jgi:aspartate beta-hydroxylase
MTDVAALAEAGMAALRRGDAAAARPCFEQLAAAGHGDASVYFGLAHACVSLGDHPAALAALDRALDHEPANLHVLALKAEVLAAGGDLHGAANYARAILRAAPAPLPAAQQALVQRARQMVDKAAASFEGHLLGTLAQAGLDDAPEAARFRHSLDLLLGKKQIFLQQPRLYYFPGLAPLQFFDHADFPWLKALEAATPAIRAEVLAVLQDHAAFQPYLRPDPSRPQLNRGGMHNNRDWSAFYLWEDGKLNAANAARCPATMAALEHVPLPRIPGRSPSVLFSLLRPGAHIPPHTGILNTRLIVHLPLLVPPACQLRVGNETRTWEEGKAWVFDDSIEHEAWNRSDETRVILLLEIWRPELNERERQLVGTMLEAIDAYRGGSKADWDM